MRLKALVPALATALAAAVAVTLAPTAAAGPEQAPTAPAAAPAGAAAPATFTHPGVVVSRPQLDFVRAKVQAGAQPWKAAYDQMAASPYASLTRAPKPRAIVECGSSSNPNYGCTDERQDAVAAYTQALAWYITRDDRHARKAIEIMDAWSAVIKDHTNSNAPLQTGWAGSSWPRAAEIIKHTYTGGWANSGRFATMLRTVYLPEIINGAATKNGNWELIMTEAALGIAVHLEDRAAYDKAVKTYLGRVPAYIYLSTDGATPKPPPNSSIDTRDEIVKYWQGQSTFADGLSQETCRDFGHTGWGLAAAVHTAETSRIQGADLYPQVSERLRHALGFHTKYENGTAIPSWLCGGTVKPGLGRVTEVGFNALSGRMGISMTNTQIYTEGHRPSGTDNYFVSWETLTHAGNPN
ncbi:alginate lyase family protein [Streptomyces sp. NBC_01353]|uniref:alginate lyase family protein n=1 Tax=Streptomyces sp. NBC_01353 TaxID=2903835 RepID=UPI002E2FBCDB|nr:alginate lyase family protein [Streptomyces sp. NBC_01353]